MSNMQNKGFDPKYVGICANIMLFYSESCGTDECHWLIVSGLTKKNHKICIFMKIWALVINKYWRGLKMLHQLFLREFSWLPDGPLRPYLHAMAQSRGQLYHFPPSFSATEVVRMRARYTKRYIPRKYKLDVQFFSSGRRGNGLFSSD